jgi:MerR family transcriptional regulator, light-induced transcriptional regulator
MITESLFLEYQTKLLKGDRTGCTIIVKKLLSSVIPIKQLYLNLFQRSLYEIGSLWETNKISVATEHLCTAITESLISLTYPYLFGSEHTGKKAIIACTPGEYHQIGARMVADYFELNGWDGYFLGANTPENELIQFIEEQQPDLLAISMSVIFSLTSLEKLTKKVHIHFPNLLIILGGQGFQWGDKNAFKTNENIYMLHSLDELDEKIFKPQSYAQ